MKMTRPTYSLDDFDPRALAEMAAEDHRALSDEEVRLRAVGRTLRNPWEPASERHARRADELLESAARGFDRALRHLTWALALFGVVVLLDLFVLAVRAGWLR